MTNTPTKRCPVCGEDKPWTDFSPGNSYCRPCKSRLRMERYWSDPEFRETTKAYHRKNERRKRADPAINAVMLAKLKEKYHTNHEWRERRRQKVAAHARAYPGKVLATTARKRARERGLVCTITSAWCQAVWEANPHCVYCGRLVRSAAGKFADDSATLDKLDSFGGYTPENTVLACWRCNCLKRDSTPEELERLAANIRRVRSERGHPPI